MKNSFRPASIFFLLTSAILFPYARGYADNPDTFQYLDIAHKYLSGHWMHALNGYWSPLISWLLTIPLMIFSDELIAFKVLQLCIGVFTLYQWNRFVRSTSLKDTFRHLLVFSSIPFLVNYSMLNCTPDLLFIGLVLYILNLLPGSLYASAKRKQVQLAFAGTLLFFTKSFGFPFFIVLTLFSALITGKKLSGIQRPLMTIGIFLLMCLPWIVAISFQYGHPTISEAAAFNMNSEVAPLPGKAVSLPILSGGLNAPGENSLSAWETPGLYTGQDRVNLFTNTNDYMQVVKRNFLTIYYFDFRNQLGLFWFILLLFYLWYFGLSHIKHESWLQIALLVFLLLYFGYSLILVHTRYVWLNSWLMLLMSLWFLQNLLGKEGQRIARRFFTVLLLLIAIKRPLKEIMFSGDRNIPLSWFYKSIRHPFTTLWVNYRPERELVEFIDELERRKFAGGNMASLKSGSKQRDSYTGALRIARALNNKYYGQIDTALPGEMQETELKKHKIQFLITWNNQDWPGREPLYASRSNGIRIYKIE